MNNLFIPYEQALHLKELGFQEECLAYYHQDQMLEKDSFGIKRDHYRGKFGVLAPLYQQAFRFFREKYNLLYTIEETLEDDEVWYEWTIKTPNGFEGSVKPTYEEAELACLKKLIEIAKNK